MDSYIVTNIADSIVVFVSESSGRIDFRMDILSSVNYAVIKPLPFALRSYSLDYGVGHDRSGIVSYHASPLSRNGPFRQELILPGYICKSKLNLFIYRRIHKVQEREESSECIPETGVGIEVAVTYLSVVRTVMNRLARGIDLIEFTREKQTSVQARIKCAVLVFATSAHLDSSQHIIPALLGIITYFSKRPVTDFLKICPCLFQRNEGRSRTDVDLFTSYSAEAYRSKCMISFEFGSILYDLERAVADSEVFYRLVKLYYEPVPEIIRNATAVLGCITYDSIFFRKNLDERTVVVCVDYYS